MNIKECVFINKTMCHHIWEKYKCDNNYINISSKTFSYLYVCCELRTTSCELLSCELWAVSCELKLWAASCEMWAASSVPLAANSEMRAVSCELRAVSCELPTASCGLPIVRQSISVYQWCANHCSGNHRSPQYLFSAISVPGNHRSLQFLASQVDSLPLYVLWAVVYSLSPD